MRNEKTRDDLRALVGDIGLVLCAFETLALPLGSNLRSRTLQESKGLEFDDVRALQPVRSLQ